ncbi:MAG: hypothetical protein ACREHV_07785 [Rhizomicrobium sp.]
MAGGECCDEWCEAVAAGKAHGGDGTPSCHPLGVTVDYDDCGRPDTSGYCDTQQRGHAWGLNPNPSAPGIPWWVWLVLAAGAVVIVREL